MDAINSLMGAVLRGYLAALAWAPPVTGLILISLLAGVGMLWVFKKTSDPRRIRAVKHLQMAYLLEMRIYREEPGVVWRAQTSLLAANLRYIGLMVRPALWMAAPGIPKNSEDGSSWASTVPPTFLMAFTPMEPSLPEPLSTTAIARSLKLPAVDSKSRSAEGRTK